MSTNATLWKKNAEGSYDGVYIHWDGYIKDGVGQMLHENWKSPTRVGLLIEQGDISSLGSTLESTVFYSRDKGEAWSDVRPALNVPFDVLKDTNYTYIFDGEWFVLGDRGTLIPIGDLV